MSLHYLLDAIVALICTIAGFLLIRWARPMPSARTVRALLATATVMVWVQLALSTARVANQFDHYFVQWLRCLGLTCGGLLLYSAAIVPLLRSARAFDPGRRKVLQVGVTAAAAVPALVGSFAFIRRKDLRLREVSVRVPGLPKDLDGLRIVQVTDIHLGPFLDEATLNHAVGMANETKPHIALVTGDLISTKGDPLDKCIERLGALRSEAGLWGCLGNHERYALAEDYTEQESRRVGLRFLRHESATLHFGSATLNLAGVDYQRKGTPYLLGAESLIVPGAYNILLSHSPDVFDVAARQGFDLTIAGHTHGGQVTFEMVHPSLNIARFYTPWVHGLYERSGKNIYVSRGIGTIGVPARLGATPEVVLLRLCAI
ncbi:MAG: metallophosphoesterase [Bryobacteraceae bacterium]|nr:metallophosphoesterase [Bryobacteraceae bacterium]